MIRFLITLVLALATSRSATVYISQSGAGGQTGADCANAHSVAWFNSNTLSPGDTCLTCLTITNGLVFQSSGTVGSPIVLSASDASSKLSRATLANGSKWINVEGRSNIVIHDLEIALTDNGTGLSFSNAVTGIWGAGIGCERITITNCHIHDLFTRNSISNAPPSTAAIHMIGSYLTIRSNYIDQIHGGIVLPYNPSIQHDNEISRNVITNYNHAVESGAGAGLNPIQYNLTIVSNRFESGDAYESPDSVELGLHRNAIFLFNESGIISGSYSGYISNHVISHNFIRHGANPQSHTAGTGAMFQETHKGGLYKNGKVVNNISTLVEPLAWSGGGGFISGAGDGTLIANNTVLGWGSGSTLSSQGQISMVGTNNECYNNIIISGQGISAGAYTPTLFTNNAATTAAVFANTHSDYNIFNKQNGSQSFVTTMFVDNNAGPAQNGIYNTLTDWRAAGGGALTANFDPHSITTTVTLDSNYSPNTVANQGTNLFSRGITTDFYGNARSGSGAFTIGAVNFGSNPTSTNSPIVITGKVTLRGGIGLRVVQ